MTSERLGARIDIGPVEIDGWRYDLYLVTACGADTVTVDVRGIQPSRVGTVVNPGCPTAEDLHLAEPMHTARKDQYGAQIVAAVRSAYLARRP